MLWLVARLRIADLPMNRHFYQRVITGATASLVMTFPADSGIAIAEISHGGVGTSVTATLIVDGVDAVMTRLDTTTNIKYGFPPVVVRPGSSLELRTSSNNQSVSLGGYVIYDTDL